MPASRCQNFMKVPVSGSLPLAAWCLNLVTWVMNLAPGFWKRLVLDAWRLMLDACGLTLDALVVVVVLSRLTLVAWRLWLDSHRLTLEAFIFVIPNARSCELDNVRPLLIFKNDSGRIKWPSLDLYIKVYFVFLVFTICNIFNIFVPACSTVFTFIILIRSWTSSGFRVRWYCRRVRPWAQRWLVNHGSWKSNC